MTKQKLYLLSVVLGIGIVPLLWAIQKLPYGYTVAFVLSFPGLLFASIFYDGGMHSDAALAWLAVAVVMNVVIYTFIWFILLRQLNRQK
jgi:hypothetical protein